MRDREHRAAAWGLPACGAAVLLLAGALCAFGDLRESVGWFVALWSAWFVLLGAAWWCARRVAVPRAVWVILAVAVLARVLMLAMPASLSDDWYRYLWDGRLTVEGYDPYAAVPTDPAVAALRDDVLLPNMNSPDYFTVYPPVSQAAFAAACWLGDGDAYDALYWLKAIFAAGDTLGVVAVLGMLGALGIDRRRVLLYAWNPLPIVELVGAAHSEALLVAPLAGCVWAALRGRDALAGGLLALAVWVKLFPVLAVLTLARFVGVRRAVRAAVACLLVGVLVGWPMLRPEAIRNVVDSLGLYAGVFSFNHGLFHALWWAGQQVSDAEKFEVYRTVSRLMLLAFGVFYLGVTLLRPIREGQRKRWLIGVLLVAFGGYLVANATLHPWYVAWVLWLVPAAVGFARPWLWLSLAVGWSYWAYRFEPASVPWPIVAVTWLGFGALLLLDLLRLFRRRAALQVPV